MFCNNCSKPNESDANFCIHCGKSLLSTVGSTKKRNAFVESPAQNPKIGLRELKQYFAKNYILLTGVFVSILIFTGIGYFFKFGEKVRIKPRLAASNHASNSPVKKVTELCDRINVLNECNRYLLNNNPRSCLTLSNNFLKSCGEYDQLHNYRNTAARRLSDWKSAMDSANKLVELYPLGANPYFIRAQTYSEMGDFAAAISDYEQTLTLMPGEIQTPFELADLYLRINQPCLGISPLEQYTYLHPNEAENAKNLLSVLYKNPQCADIQGKGKGKAKIRMNKQGSAIFTKVTINNHQQGNFIVDTGASLVTLSKSFADRLKLDYAGWPKMLTQTANGIGVAYRGYVDSISLQGLEAKHIEVAIIEELGASDGLLGLSFLNRFKIELDSDKGYMLMTARSR